MKPARRVQPMAPRVSSRTPASTSQPAASLEDPETNQAATKQIAGMTTRMTRLATRRMTNRLSAFAHIGSDPVAVRRVSMTPTMKGRMPANRRAHTHLGCAE
jgi:hypothetical protein